MKIFIACAEETLPFANNLKFRLCESLQKSYADLKIDMWDSQFHSGDITLSKLIDISNTFDFAIFIFHPVDKGVIKGENFSIPRDNVIFEYGLFLSNISKERCFVLRPKNFFPKLRMPSDLSDVTYVPYEDGSIDKIDTFNPAHIIQQRILELGTRKASHIDMNVLEIGNVFKNIGLTNAFPARAKADIDILRDIASVKESIEMYSRVYISSIIKAIDFEDSVLKAVKSISSETDLLIRHISTDSEQTDLAERQFKLEDPGQDRWDGVEKYISHLKGSTNIFNLRYKSIKTKVDQDDLLCNNKRKIIFRRQYLNYIMPYSLIILDKRIIYVSFYSLSPNNYGEQAPTLRLVKTENESWASSFLQETKHIDKHITRQETDQIIKSTEQ